MTNAFQEKPEEATLPLVVSPTTDESEEAATERKTRTLLEPKLLLEPLSPPGCQHHPKQYPYAPPSKVEEEKKEVENEDEDCTGASLGNSYHRNTHTDDSDVSTTYFGTEGSIASASLVSSADRTRASATTVSRTNTTKPQLPLVDDTETSISADDLNVNQKSKVQYVDEDEDDTEAGGITVIVNKKKEDEMDDETYYKEQNAKRREERKLGCYMFLSGLVGVIIASVLLALELPQNESSSAVLNANTTGQTASESTPALLELLALPPSTLEVLRSNPQSPQGQAFAWLRQDPHWATDYDQQRARQRYGLSVLYYATRGDEWRWDDMEAHDSSFLSYDIHECDWMPHKASFGCDSSERMTSLGLHHMGLQGSIPMEVWSILAPSTLTKVEMGQNQITGTLVTHIGMLSRLTHLDISQNQLNANLPSEIGRCQSLEILVISDNPSMQGNLPTQLGLLNNLQGLWWTNSGISGPIPSELGRLSLMQLLELSGNSLTGSVPPALFGRNESRMPDSTTIETSRSSSDLMSLNHNRTTLGLREIRLDRNQIGGSIPSDIVLLASSLTKLDLSHNRFEKATLPTFLGDMTELRDLQVGGNHWTGALPSELGLLSVNLVSLGLSEGKFTGSIPSEISQLTNLHNFYLHSNHGIKGKIVDQSDVSTPDISSPFAVGLLTNLREFTIINTPFSGTIPSTLCNIPILSFSCDPQTLCGCDCECPVITSAPSNLITSKPTSGPTFGSTEIVTTAPSISFGAVRESILQLLPSYTRAAIEEYPDGPQASALTWIQDDPYIGAYRDSQRIRRFALAVLYYSLYGSTESTQVKKWLVYETHECFWLSEHATKVSCLIIDGELEVTSLDLDVRQVKGTLPAEVALLSSLLSLRSTGTLAGSLSPEVGRLSDLQHLAIHEHHLHGSLPSEIGLISSLVTLNLAGSQASTLNGTIPSEFGALTQLESFDVSRNSLTGRIPETFPDSLQVLDLSHNRFVGTIPIASWGPSMAGSLKRLHFHHNPLRGILVSEIGYFSQLSSLVLTRSHLGGNLPTELGLLSRLHVFDVSWNTFSGHIPTWLGQMTALRDLYLNDNSFRGGIPSEIGLMTHLEKLLLHDNDMVSGRIPRFLTALPFLETFTVNKTFVAGLVPPGLCSLNHFNFSCSVWLCGCESCACP